MTRVSNLAARFQSLRPARVIALVILPLLAACGGGDGGTDPDTTLNAAISEGNGLSAVAGDPVSTRQAVKVTNGSGAARAGVSVTFAVTSGGGTATGTTQQTDASGIARVGGWTLGPQAGANTMSATVTGVNVPLVFTVQGTAGAASALTRVAGDAQSAAAGTAVATRPSVRVNDRNGNPVSGVAVTFVPSANSGTVSTPSVSTGADGVATVGAWTLATTTGAQTLTASVAGITTTVSFAATATTGPAALLVKQAGDAQVAPVATALFVAPSLKVTDQFGNPVSGATVTFAVASGGGTITGATAQTNASGIATIGSWALGTTAGTQTLNASVAGITAPVTFTATAMPGAPLITKQGGDAQTATVGTNVPVAPSVKVADQYGNPITGREVRFEVASGGGSVSGGTPLPNAAGIATVGGWTMGTTAGPQSLTATVAGVPTTLTFTATANPGPAASLTKTAGDAQTAAMSTLLPINPAVRISDQYGNVVSGRTVTFAVTGGGGTLTGATQASGANGIATVGGWTLGSTLGAQTMQATLDALSVVFSATATGLLNVQQYVGTYNGTWINTTFGSTGTGSVTIANDAVTKTATVTASATGSVLGTGSVAPTTRSSVYGTSSGTFSGNVPPMGTINGTIDAAGNIVAAGTNVPNAGISRWNVTGTITPTQIQLSFTVTFTSGAPAAGTITLIKP